MADQTCDMVVLVPFAFTRAPSLILVEAMGQQSAGAVCVCDNVARLVKIMRSTHLFSQELFGKFGESLQRFTIRLG